VSSAKMTREGNVAQSDGMGARTLRPPPRLTASGSVVTESKRAREQVEEMKKVNERREVTEMKEEEKEPDDEAPSQNPLAFGRPAWIANDGMAQLPACVGTKAMALIRGTNHVLMCSSCSDHFRAHRRETLTDKTRRGILSSAVNVRQWWFRARNAVRVQNGESAWGWDAPGRDDYAVDTPQWRDAFFRYFYAAAVHYRRRQRGVTAAYFLVVSRVLLTHPSTAALARSLAVHFFGITDLERYAPDAHDTVPQSHVHHSTGNGGGGGGSDRGVRSVSSTGSNDNNNNDDDNDDNDKSGTRSVVVTRKRGPDSSRDRKVGETSTGMKGTVAKTLVVVKTLAHAKAAAKKLRHLLMRDFRRGGSGGSARSSWGGPNAMVHALMRVELESNIDIRDLSPSELHRHLSQRQETVYDSILAPHRLTTSPNSSAASSTTTTPTSSSRSTSSFSSQKNDWVTHILIKHSKNTSSKKPPSSTALSSSASSSVSGTARHPMSTTMSAPACVVSCSRK
jgi:hypothetical protein